MMCRAAVRLLRSARAVRSPPRWAVDSGASVASAAQGHACLDDVRCGRGQEAEGASSVVSSRFQAARKQRGHTPHLSLPDFAATLSLPRSHSTTSGAGAGAAAAGTTGTAHARSVDPTEAAKFDSLASAWWDRSGPHSMLQRMNPVRVAFIRSALCRHFKRREDAERPLEGIRLLDVGCGGGLLCEPLCRLGASVTGVDVVPSNITAALHHASASNLTEPHLTYACKSAEELVEEGQRYDAVTCLEVLEHVRDPLTFVTTLSSLSSPSGAVVLSTINRTPRSFALAVVAAEYVLGIVPRGTHEWAKFLSPAELAAMLRQAGPFRMQELAGMVFDPLSGHWSLSSDTEVNYIVFASKA